MAIDEIKRDLRDIKSYYRLMDVFKKTNLIPPASVVEKAERYGKIIATAPTKLYAVYVALYVENSTQEQVAKKWGYTKEHIKQLNKKLCEFIEKNLD